MRDGTLLAEAPPNSLIQAQNLPVSTAISPWYFSLLTSYSDLLCLLFVCLQTLEEVFLKLCRRQEEEKGAEYEEKTSIVSLSKIRTPG